MLKLALINGVCFFLYIAYNISNALETGIGVSRLHYEIAAMLFVGSIYISYLTHKIAMTEGETLQIIRQTAELRTKTLEKIAAIRAKTEKLFQELRTKTEKFFRM